MPRTATSTCSWRWRRTPTSRDLAQTCTSRPTSALRRHVRQLLSQAVVELLVVVVMVTVVVEPLSQHEH